MSTNCIQSLTGPISSLTAKPRQQLDISEYIQNIKDRGTYRTVRNIVKNSEGGSVSVRSECFSPGSLPYPSLNSDIVVDTGVLWSFNIKNSYNRFKSNTPEVCTVLTDPITSFPIETSYVGNDTITNSLSNNK